MEQTWRWFGPQDPISLTEVRQVGATGIVTALHEIPNGTPWPAEAIAERKAMIEDAGLRWSVVESIPIHEDVKRGGPRAQESVDAWTVTLGRLADAGLDTVCYNFMPVLDWTRTTLDFAYPDGALALGFDRAEVVAFDAHVLRREGALDGLPEDLLEAVERVRATWTEADRDRLTRTVLAGLPGSEESWDLDGFRAALASYGDTDAAALAGRLTDFLSAVVPVAQERGMRLAIHPDDPPLPLFGLPRVVSTAADARRVVESVPSPANGLTLCVGSYGSHPDTDVLALARDLAEHIHFAHLRTVQRGPWGSFTEAPHLEGDVDIVGIIEALLREEDRRGAGSRPIPMRPDHGHRILDDVRRTTNPGYSLYGRMRGLAELRGVATAVRHRLDAERR